MADLNSIIVTVRTSDERTEQACIQSVLDEGVSGNQIHIIKETPFKKALEMCFKKAFESDAKWLLTLDADMILIPGVIKNLIIEAEKMPDHFIQIQARILDKFYGEVRGGGPRIYRVKHLGNALRVSQSLKDDIRPETNIIKVMGRRGYHSRYISPCIALHDFEQYFTDIYRKACVHAVKHMSKLPIILEQAVKYKVADADYQVILKGIYDSLSKGMDVKIDNRIYIDEAKEALSTLKLEEKTDIPVTIQTSKILASYSISKNDQSFTDCTQKDVPSTRMDTFKKTMKRKGLIKCSAIYIGLIFSFLGKRLSRFGKR
jgi:predicted nucleic acid-binding protein